jgi:hypothetical protein
MIRLGVNILQYSHRVLDIHETNLAHYRVFK